MALGSSLPTRLPFSTGGTTYYVDGTLGSDTTGTGSVGSPWKTINKALSTVSLTGSIIIVKAGTYTSSGSSYVLQWSRAGNTSNPVTIKAETPGAVTIAAPSGNTTSTIGAWCVGSTGLRIQDITFTVRGGGNSSSSGILIQNSSSIELYRCTFVNMGGASVLWRGGEGTACSNLWLYACTLGPCGLDCTGGYYDVKGTHHAYLGQYQSTASVRSGVEGGVVANCVFYGRAPGRHLQIGPQFRNGFVVNNTFYGNTGTASTDSGGGVELFNENSTWTTSGNIIKNNIFSTLRGHAVYGSTFSPGLTGNIVAKNLAYNLTNAPDGISDDYPANYASNAQWPLFAETGGQISSADPLFTNPTGGDFSLQTASPAAGVAELEYAPTEDFNGTARNAATPSLGAFEANSVPSTPPTSDTHIGGFTAGSTLHQPAGDIKTATKWNVASTVYVDRLEAYVDGAGSGSGTANIRLGIYSDTAGSPASLVVSSSPIAITDGQAAGWVTADISTTQITSGDKWFALITDSATVRIYGGDAGASGIEKYNSDTYSDGFASTFGATSNETGTLNIRARILQAPENTILPSVGGTVVEGDTVTVNPATWTGTPTFTYQWQRATTAGGTFSNISSQTASTYVLTTGDIGYYIRCTVTATNTAGSDSVSSAAVGPVTALPTPPPDVDGGGSGLSMQPTSRGTLTLTPAEQA